MVTFQIPSEEEICIVARQGENAVVAMVGELVRVLTLLARRVQELEDRLSKKSSNSSKPPSSDGMSQPKRTRSLRKPSGKRSGAQAGHAGHRLEVAEKPDEVKRYPVKHCTQCQSSLESAELERLEKRQEYELPAIRLVVIEHQAEVKRCPQCGSENQAEFPGGITQPTQYGVDFKALLVYLNQKQFVPLKRVVEFCVDVLGQTVGEGTIVGASHEAAQIVEPVNQQIRERLIETEDPSVPLRL